MVGWLVGQSRGTETVGGVPYARAMPPLTYICVHCDDEVRSDGHGDWVHARGLYRCQSSTVAYGHLAHPADIPCRADGPNPCLGASVMPPAG